MVMGTGSLSTGALLLGWRWLSDALFAVAGAGLVLLSLLESARFLRHRHAIDRDLRDPKRAFAAYTFVAALAVGTTRGALAGWVLVPAAALPVGIVGAVTLAIPGLRLVRANAERVDAATGNWQLPSVAVETLALLAAVVGVRWRSDAFLAVAVTLWLAGLPAYAAVLPVFVRRVRRAPFGPQDFTPDYWTLPAVPSLVALVATVLRSAISTAPTVSWLGSTYGPVALVGLVVSGTLLPAWVILQVRRLMVDPAARRYSPVWWGVVFPTAIMVVAAAAVGSAFGPGWLHTVAVVGYWCVLAVWATVGLGLVRNLRPELRSPGA
jgi:tellurite resistance protein TehA-like permease